MHLAFMGYPISAGFKARFEQLVGHAPNYLGLPELRKLSLAGSLRKLLNLSARHIYLLLEDECSQPILPLLQAVAICSPARTFEVVHGDLRREPFSRLSVIPRLLDVALASTRCGSAVRASQRSCERLLAEPRAEFAPANSGRVLYLKTNLWFGVKAGGSVGHVAGVVNGLLASGRQIDFFGTEPPAMVEAQARFHEIAPPRRYGLPVEANVYRFGRTVVDQVVRQVPGKRYDFIYQRMSFGNFSGVELSRKLRLPLVLEYNGSEVWVHRNWGKAMRYAKAAELAELASLRHAHLVVTVSDVLRDELINRGIAPDRIVSYPNGIDPRIFDPARFSTEHSASLRRKLGIEQDAIVPLFLGTCGQWHGVPVLARAVRKLSIERADWLRKHKVCFLFVGDGVTMPEVRETLADPRCQPFYKLAGLVPQAEAPQYLAMADLLLSPHVSNPDGSRFFGSPTKLFEYMAMARGIVASDLDQIGEVLKNSLHVNRLPSNDPQGSEPFVGVLTPPNEVDGLISGIQFLVEQPAWRTALGANARAEALSRYTWQHHVRAFLERIPC